MLATLLPEMQPAYDRARQNRLQWETYVETDEDKKVYQIKKQHTREEEEKKQNWTQQENLWL